ncbi:glycosyltransferase [Paenibacillaceae bacterium]|nr:glycosyltransferase [Paenibacillaceae bacterium]
MSANSALADKVHDWTTADGKVPVVPIFGLSFSRLDMKQTVSYLSDNIQAGRVMQIVTGNPIMVMYALENPTFFTALDKAELIVPDGTGVVWAANYVGTPVAERVAGFDLLHELMEEGERHRWTAYLLGSTQEVIEEAAARLRQRYPLVRIVGFRNGFFTEDEDEAVIAEIRRAKPDMLFVARAVDNQETWIAKHKEALGVPLMMGVGGSFDSISGKTKRAPVLFQKLRLEWFYRLLREPTRYRRMLALPKFAAKVVREKENVTKRPSIS